MEILAVVITILFAIIHGRYDGDQINRKKSINYPVRWFLRAGVMGGMSYYVTYRLGLDFNSFLILTAILFSFFWIIFDIAVNEERNKGPFYIGKTSFIDRQLRKIGIYYTLLLKVFLLIVSGIGYIMYIDYITI